MKKLSKKEIDNKIGMEECLKDLQTKENETWRKEKKEKYEQKFIVINYKRFEEMDKAWDENPNHHIFQNHPEIELFLNALERFNKALERFNKAYEEVTGKKLDQKYIVINEDEPYIQEIYKIMNLDRGEIK